MAASRPVWKGQLRLSLVPIDVEPFPAHGFGAPAAFNQPSGKRVQRELRARRRRVEVAEDRAARQTGNGIDLRAALGQSLGAGGPARAGRTTAKPAPDRRKAAARKAPARRKAS